MPPKIQGLIPAGGRATRLASLTCSKEIIPLGSVTDAETGAKRNKVVSEFLIDSFRRAGIENAFFVLAPGKWDIPAHFGNGAGHGIHLAYLVRQLPFGVPYTLDTAFPFVQDVRVAFGFPDIIFQPEDAVARLLARQDAKGADIVLGIFPVADPQKWDGVKFDQHRKIRRIVTKPHTETAGFTWILSVWNPVFTRFMHEYVATSVHTPAEDVSLGLVVQAALDHGLSVDHVIFDEGFCLDIGTPDDLEKALTLHDRQDAPIGTKPTPSSRT